MVVVPLRVTGNVFKYQVVIEAFVISPSVLTSPFASLLDAAGIGVLPDRSSLVWELLAVERVNFAPIKAAAVPADFPQNKHCVSKSPVGTEKFKPLRFAHTLVEETTCDIAVLNL